MTLVFTLCSNNYLAQAITLGQSLLQHNSEYAFKIGLVDRKAKEIDYSSFPFEVIEVEKISIAPFEDMFKRYSITELNTAVKPFYFLHFFNDKVHYESVIYLDPDIMVYNPFTELYEELKEKNIVITPHFTTPISDNKFQQEEDFLNAGLYNLGFIAIKNSEEGNKMAQWWANHLTTKAYVRFEKGLFTDQIWINFVPLFFKNVSILKHPGYNMAYWNLHERGYNYRVVFNNKEYPLVFFHFSGYNPHKPDCLSKYQNRFDFSNRKDILPLFDDYKNTLHANNYNTFIKIPCFFIIEKEKLDLDNYLAFKKNVPFYKRLIRGIVLRIISIFKVTDINYYIK